jgi:hypothetical protein
MILVSSQNATGQPEPVIKFDGLNIEALLSKIT